MLEKEKSLLNRLTLQIWERYPHYFFKDIFGMEPYPYQKRVLQELADLSIKRVMILAAGGTGKTRLLACLALYLAVPKATSLGRPISVIIISGSADQAKYLYSYCREAISRNNILNSLVKGEPLVSKTEFKNGSVIFAVPNSLTVIQGKHCDVVIIDEAAIAGDFVVRDALRITSTSDIDRIILSGTPMQYDSLFVDMWENPTSYPDWDPRKNTFARRYHWSARECPKISIERLEEAKRLPPDLYAIFWEGKPYALTNTVVPREDLVRASKNIHTEYDPNIESIAGLDWGFGAAETVLVIVQKRDNIYYVVGVFAWTTDEMENVHDAIQSTCRQYNVRIVYADAAQVGENQRLSSRGVYVKPIHFSKEKSRLQGRMRALFHQGRIRIDEEEIELLRQLRKYTWDTHEDDDRVDALMLAINEEEKEQDIWWTVL